MAQAGRKPRHPNLKLLNGRTPDTDSGGRKVKPPPGFVRVAPEPPSWLSREAKAEWRRVVPELERLGLLKLASRSSLAIYCSAWANFAAAVQAGDEAAQLRFSRELRAWCAEFGLTPSSENRLTVPDAATDDEGLD